MALTVPQKTICDDVRRFRVVCAGRRFGKTHLLTRELARHATPPDQRVWAIYPSFRMGKQILWKPLKKKLIALNWVKSINESDLTIILINGSEISIRSADNFDSMRGVGLNFAALDEFADMSPEVWTEVIRPTLSNTLGHALFVGTPKGMNHFKDIFDMARIDPDNWAAYQYTTIDGGNVPASEIEAARRDLDERTFRQEYEASFETYAGVIYYAFGNHNIGDTPEVTEKDTLLIGLDFNVDPLSAVVALRRENHLHIVQEIVISGATTHDLVAEIRRKYPRNRVEVFPDASGAQRRTSTSDTDHIILKNAGYTLRVRGTNPAVLDRIAAVNSRLKSTTGGVHITVNKNCRKLIKGLGAQVYKEGTRVPDKDSGLDHLNDAFGYMINWMWPIRRDMDIRDQPTHWSTY